MVLNKLIDKLLISFKDENVKKDVLDDCWYLKNKQNNIDSTGFCFYANEIIYRLTGGKENWKLMRISKDDFNEGPHYYLINKNDNTILDITSDQYTKLGIFIPYDKGKGRGLQNISKKSKILAKYINENL